MSGPEETTSRAMAADCLRVMPCSGRREKGLCLRSADRAVEEEIELAPLGVRGGNLLVADGRLLIATPSELIVLATNGGKTKERAEITKNGE